MCILKSDINIIHTTDNMLSDKTFKWLPQHTYPWRQFENERVRKSFRALTDTSWTIPTLIDRVKFWIVSLRLSRFFLKKSPASPLPDHSLLPARVISILALAYPRGSGVAIIARKHSRAARSWLRESRIYREPTAREPGRSTWDFASDFRTWFDPNQNQTSSNYS